MRTIQRCERCGGNVLFSPEEQGGEWRCLQCGRTHEPAVQFIHPPVEVHYADVRCEECNIPLPAVASSRRRYCSDRCRMRAARRRWSGSCEGVMAV